MLNACRGSWCAGVPLQLTRSLCTQLPETLAYQEAWPLLLQAAELPQCEAARRPVMSQEAWPLQKTCLLLRPQALRPVPTSGGVGRQRKGPGPTRRVTRLLPRLSRISRFGRRPWSCQKLPLHAPAQVTWKSRSRRLSSPWPHRLGVLLLGERRQQLRVLRAVTWRCRTRTQQRGRRSLPTCKSRPLRLQTILMATQMRLGTV